MGTASYISISILALSTFIILTNVQYRYFFSEDIFDNIMGFFVLYVSLSRNLGINLQAGKAAGVSIRVLS